jgi:hypothetical protein
MIADMPYVETQKAEVRRPLDSLSLQQHHVCN